MRTQGNEVMDGDGFYISYNTGERGLYHPDAEQETALVYKGNFYILNGDYRHEYEEALPHGFDACLAVFLKYRDEHQSSWSNHWKGEV